MSIKVWMLTGDKLETARCVAISTGFKQNHQTFCEVTATDYKGILREFSAFDQLTSVLLVNGSTLDIILSDHRLRSEFIRIAKVSPSVVLCRCSPRQKADITLLLKKQFQSVICTVGDGGNDVGMI